MWQILPIQWRLEQRVQDGLHIRLKRNLKYKSCFTKSAANFIRENPGRSYTLKTKELFAHDIVRNDEVAWKSGNHGTMEIVEQTMKKNNILVTRRIYEVKGGLFDQQIMKKGKGQIPIKGGDERLKNIYKYGGYNKASGAYFMLVKSLDKKNNEQRTLEFLPIYMKDYVEQSEEKAQEYLVTNRKLKNPEIILPKVKIDTLFKVDGFYMWLSGRTKNQLKFKCANQLILSEEDVKILKKVIKFINRKKENKDIVLNDYDGITEEDAGNLYETFIRKLKDSIYKKRLALQGETLENKRKEFEALSLEDKCIVLGEILHLFQCQSGAANLKLIGGPASAGILVMNTTL